MGFFRTFFANAFIAIIAIHNIFFTQMFFASNIYTRIQITMNFHPFSTIVLALACALFCLELNAQRIVCDETCKLADAQPTASASMRMSSLYSTDSTLLQICLLRRKGGDINRPKAYDP